MKDDYSKKVEMICPVCGGKMFEHDSEVPDGPVKCISCNRSYSRDQLVKAN
jgi:formylmethanofuran dehydrogenase subunit E